MTSFRGQKAGLIAKTTKNLSKMQKHPFFPRGMQCTNNPAGFITKRSRMMGEHYSRSLLACRLPRKRSPQGTEGNSGRARTSVGASANSDLRHLTRHPPASQLAASLRHLLQLPLGDPTCWKRFRHKPHTRWHHLGGLSALMAQPGGCRRPGSNSLDWKPGRETARLR